jgi:Ca2+-binding RTX toxin-like protein
MAIVNGTNASDPNLEGTAQADQVFGLAGNDNLIGLGGDDVLEGGAGADELFGSGGFDYASYRASDRAVRIDLDAFSFSGGHADGDNLYSIEGVIGSAFNDVMIGTNARCVFRGENGKDSLAGGAEADALYGGNGDDRLDGFAGNDTLEGGSGNDILIGWAGDDTLRGGAGIDTVAMGYVSGGMILDLASGTARGDVNFGFDRLSGIENVVGTPLNDQIAGDGAANVLTGSFGADTLRGRGGADRFDFNYGDESDPKAPDLILDFTRSQGDRIDLRDIDANEQITGNQNFAFIGQAQFSGAGQVRFYHDQGMTIIEADTSTAIGGPEPVIVLQGLISLRAADFIL